MVRRQLSTLRLGNGGNSAGSLKKETGKISDDISRTLENPEEIFEIEIDGKIVKVQRLRVDSSNWKTINIEGKQLKISPTGWIVEFEGEQYFDLTVAKKAIKMDYKDIPNGEILEKIMEKLLLNENFKNRMPGVIATKNTELIGKGETIILCGSSLEDLKIPGVIYIKGPDEIKKSFFNPGEFLFPFLTIE